VLASQWVPANCHISGEDASSRAEHLLEIFQFLPFSGRKRPLIPFLFIEGTRSEVLNSARSAG